MILSIVHCIIDDKFLDDAIYMFNSLENIENSYYLVSRKEKSYKYLRYKNIQRITPSDFLMKFKKGKSCDLLILHGLVSLPTNVISQISQQIKVIWFSWGYDLYSNKWPQFKLIKIKNRIKGKVYSNHVFHFKYYIKAFLHYGFQGKTSFKKAINRVDYYSGVFPIEYDLLKKHSFFKAKRIDFNYTRADFFKKEDIEIDDIYSGCNIIIGNSASYFSNHEDSFDRISVINLNNRKIIVPLSYGNTQKYVQHVINRGKKLFGVYFFPLVDFLPYKEYSQLLNSCSVAIFNIEQQAAVGNIIAMIWNGAKIFMPKTSMGYIHFNKIGIKIYSIEDELIQKEIDTCLDRNTIMANRIIISNLYSFDAVKSKLESSLNLIRRDLNVM